MTVRSLNHQFNSYARSYARACTLRAFLCANERLTNRGGYCGEVIHDETNEYDNEMKQPAINGLFYVANQKTCLL